MGARDVCALLLFAGAVLLALRPRPRAATLAWAVLLLAALANAGILSLMPRNLINNNNLQQYLGAKYVFRYADFQALVNAARGQPQIEMRDLKNPSVILREDPRAQRAYFIDLLRAEGVQFDPFASLENLRLQSKQLGVLQRESERILAEGLAPESVDLFRIDVETAAPHLKWVDITTDYGFNGSPFYASVRKLDPTVHRPFGRGTALFGLAFQALSVGLVVWLLQLTFALRPWECLATAALVFASWDFTAYALPGLTFAGLWLPIAVAGLAVKRGQHALAGVGVAIAGLMKLFPFVLLLPSAAAILADAWQRVRPRSQLLHPVSTDIRGAWVTIFTCAVLALVLGVLSSRDGRSWADFTAKITAQFGPDSYILNSVSASHGLLALGIHDSPVVVMVTVVASVAIFALSLFGTGRGRAEQSRFLWIVIASTGFLVHMWLNYYAMAPLFLLPFLARSHRLGAALSVTLLAISSILPDYDDPAIRSLPLRACKLAPYFVVPAWMLMVEMRDRVNVRTVRRALVAFVVLAALVVVGESMRLGQVRHLQRYGDSALDAGHAADAIAAYKRLLKLRSGHAPTEMNLGVAIAQAGRMQEAGPHFARAAELAPTDPFVLKNYGMWLRLMGRLEGATEQYEKLCALVPWSDEAHLELAQTYLQSGRRSDARSSVIRALELWPENSKARELKKQVESEGAP